MASLRYAGASVPQGVPGQPYAAELEALLDEEPDDEDDEDEEPDDEDEDVDGEDAEDFEEDDDGVLLDDELRLSVR